jgi:hypothetical protein
LFKLWRARESFRTNIVVAGRSGLAAIPPLEGLLLFCARLKLWRIRIIATFY